MPDLCSSVKSAFNCFVSHLDPDLGDQTFNTDLYSTHPLALFGAITGARPPIAESYTPIQNWKKAAVTPRLSLRKIGI